MVHLTKATSRNKSTLMAKPWGSGFNPTSANQPPRRVETRPTKSDDGVVHYQKSPKFIGSRYIGSVPDAAGRSPEERGCASLHRRYKQLGAEKMGITPLLAAYNPPFVGFDDADLDRAASLATGAYKN
jgi:hypothetical protein